MGSSLRKQDISSTYKWPSIPIPPKVPISPDHLTMEAKPYPLHPSFELTIFCSNKHSYIPKTTTQNAINTDINTIAKEFESALKQYLCSSRKDDGYRIYNPIIKKTEYLKHKIVLQFNGIITLGLITQFIFLNRSIYLKLEIKPIDFKGKTMSFGGSKLISKYMDNIILKQHHQGFKSQRGYLTDNEMVQIHMDKVHFHCHFTPETHIIALNLYKLLLSHLSEFNCNILSRSLLYQQNGPHHCWNWQIFVLYPESIGRCICFLMVNIPNQQNIYFPFHSRTFDFVPHNRFIDHCIRVGWIHEPDPIPLDADFFKDKLKEFIVPFPQNEDLNRITLEKTIRIVNYWLIINNENIQISTEITSYIYQYSLDDIRPYDIIQFWFGNLRYNKEYCIDRLIPLWMSSKKHFDDEIRNKFGLIMDDILVNNKDYFVEKWGKDYHGFGLLALVVISDQMTRNIYRGTKKAFMFDAVTQQLCLKGIDNGYFKYLFSLHPIYCWVYNLVFQHSEDIDIVKLSIDNLKWMRSKLHVSDPMYMFLDRDITIGGGYKHYKMIEKFGRYLQRDAILGRDINEEEMQYLLKSGFNKMISYNSN